MPVTKRIITKDESINELVFTHTQLTQFFTEFGITIDSGQDLIISLRNNDGTNSSILVKAMKSTHDLVISFKGIDNGLTETEHVITNIDHT